ncbi:hypothetical protein ACFSQZ_01415 [Rubritalea spongiae]|uniref:DNA-binding protein n=1 Tax=Rubritalea spongiae TaxID=430797 RepID=A0ABW5DXS3_9BACT
MTTPPSYLSMEVAEIFNITEEFVEALISAGLLEAAFSSGLHHIPVHSVDKLDAYLGYPTKMKIVRLGAPKNLKP